MAGITNSGGRGKRAEKKLKQPYEFWRNLLKFANKFSIMASVELIARIRNPAGTKQHIPFLENCVAAGFPSPALDYMEKDIDITEELIKHPSSTYFMRSKGDSMKDAFIPDNAILVVDKALKAESGRIVVAVVNGEFTLKRLVKTPRAWVLHPENPLYKPIQITEDMDFFVWGVVTKVIIDAK